MKENKPRVSVIMGVYNTPNRDILRTSIESILNQSFENFEFIICDDGCNDSTMKIIKELTKKDKRVKLIKNEKNMGLAYTLNHCIEDSNGEYIARMDADDKSALTRFEKQVEFLDNNMEYAVVASNCELFDENGIWGRRKYPEIIKKEDFLFNSPIAHPTVMMRKEALESVGNYRVAKDTIRAEDYDLFMNMYANNYKIYTIQEFLFGIREDKKCFARRKYKYRIQEVKVRYKGFKKLKLFPKGIVYLIKPLIVGAIPPNLLKRLRKLRKNEE